MEEQIRILQLQEADLRLKIAQHEETAILHTFLPHRNWPVTIYREGSKWVCMMKTSLDLTECPVAYGDCPQQACHNFDFLWTGTALVLPGQDPEVDPGDLDNEERSSYDGLDDWE